MDEEGDLEALYRTIEKMHAETGAAVSLTQLHKRLGWRMGSYRNLLMMLRSEGRIRNGEAYQTYVPVEPAKPAETRQTAWDGKKWVKQ